MLFQGVKRRFTNGKYFKLFALIVVQILSPTELVLVKMVQVPRERLNAFKDKKVLKDIEERGDVRLKLNEQVLEIEGEGDKEFFAEQVVKAICLGFDARKAFKLFKEDFYLEIIDLELACRRSAKAVERAKSRIIGSEGKCKRILQELSDADISVWGDKVALIGRYEEIQDAREAITRLLEGAQHSSVYKFLEGRKRMRD
jgi:ribosomal RNA assembly protein